MSDCDVSKMEELMSQPQPDICSDYDEDCKKVSDYSKCFLGGLSTCSNGVVAYVPMADGFCPMLEKIRD